MATPEQLYVVVDYVLHGICFVFGFTTIGSVIITLSLSLSLFFLACFVQMVARESPAEYNLDEIDTIP